MMARLRFMATALLALALAGNSVQTGRSAGQNDSRITPMPTAPYWADGHSCVSYSLTDMGYDADLGRWISQTIPEMIESKSWQQSGGSGALRYYAPKNILIVSQSDHVQAKVHDFLKKLKTSPPKTNHASDAATKKSSHASVVPADYREPALMRRSNPLPEPSSYPVPAPVKPPKHLFHFLIRYEGEGIIDDNVVKFMKGYVQPSNDQSDKTASLPVLGGGLGAGLGKCPAPDPLLSAKPPVQESSKEDDKGKAGKESP
jgi:hypothetical protein